ncbi:MAG TPA: amidohydrolase family protein [Candidatus Methylomirabilis sp.]|nr:amidohydrolase family protein [Candidatus Methylomirabilis sp.]
MPEPDLILENGTVITLDRWSTTAEALAVRNGRIVAVGPSAALAAEAGPATRRIDLEGRSVVPGFFDAHPHIDRTGLKTRGGISLAGLRSIAEIVDVVRRAAASTMPGQWIVLAPMGNTPHRPPTDPDQFEEGRLPNRHDLDAAAPDHPVYLRAGWASWAHLPCPAVANSRALAEAGVTRQTIPPPNVEIVRDSAGEPTGLFLERNYVPLLEYLLFPMLPVFSREDRFEAVRLGARLYSAAGTTSGFEGHGLTPAVITAYREVQSVGQLPVRVQAPFSVPSTLADDWRLTEFLQQCARVESDRAAKNDRLRIEGIALGGRGDRRILELVAGGYPYERWMGHFFQSLSPNRFARLGLTAARLGLRIHRVASWDLEHTLWGFETIDREESIKDQRWVAMHVSTAVGSQVQRLRQLGVIVTVCPGVPLMSGLRPDTETLSEHAVLLRELLDADIPVALSTSGLWPSMLWAMWAALGGVSGGSSCRPGDPCISREEVLRLAVQSGHLLTWSEDRRGSLEVGKDADLVVLGGNPLTCREDEIKDLAVDLTMVEGRIVHERPRPAPG